MLEGCQSKGAACALGMITCLIGSIAGLVFLTDIWQFGLFIIIWGGVLPFIGTVLIATNNYKSGAIILGIGSAILVPIGMIGIKGAQIAWRINKSKCSEKILPSHERPHILKSETHKPITQIYAESTYQKYPSANVNKKVPVQNLIMLKCPKCKKTFRVEVKPKPFNVKCSFCGKEGMMK